jgi:hypothetical protein
MAEKGKLAFMVAKENKKKNKQLLKSYASSICNKVKMFEIMLYTFHHLILVMNFFPCFPEW